MGSRSLNLKEVPTLSEFTISDLKRKYKDTYKRYQMAIERFEFLYSKEIKEELQSIKKELDNRKMILEDHS
jgi:hypothetical protein